MTIHRDHDPPELPRPALSAPLPRPWSRAEITMAVTAGVFAGFALAITFLCWAGR